MKIAVDAMGGDNAPYEIVVGAARAAREDGIEILLVGDETAIGEILDKQDYPKDKIKVIHTTEVIENDEKPTVAVREKKDSSLVRCFTLMKDGEADALVSAGSTGAMLTAAVKYTKRLEGVMRPALGAILPGGDGGVLIIDSGANANCKSAYLKQFAIMGSIYAEKVMKKKNPRIGLLSNGAEEGKGNDLTREAYPLIKEANINFVGNVEARDVLRDVVDVVVCDGFSGNVLLKATEGTGKVLLGEIKSLFMSSFVSKMCALILKGALGKLKKKFDYQEYGGAPLLGVGGCIMKTHGSAKAKAVYNTIKVANEFASAGVVSNIAKALCSDEPCEE